VIQNKPRHHFPQRGTMLESVPRPSAQQPYIFAPWMPVDNEVIVRAVLVLADASLEQGSIFQCRKSECDVVANDLEAFKTDCSLA